MEKLILEFSMEDILKDIISKKNGSCGVSDRAEFWLGKLVKRRKRE